MRHFKVEGYDHLNPKSSLVSRGVLDPDTGKVNWSKPERIMYYDLDPEPELYWPPDHNIAEAATVLGKPFSEIMYYQKIDLRQAYVFYGHIHRIGEVDAVSLEVLFVRGIGESVAR